MTITSLALATGPTAVAVAAPYGPSGPLINGTSLSSVGIGTGLKVFIVVEYGRGFAPGLRVRATNVLSGHWLEGVVTAYVAATRQITIDADRISGTGVYADWNLNVAGEPGEKGDTGDMGPQGPPATPEEGVVTEAPINGLPYARVDEDWAQITKTTVGLGNVNNTSDFAKPISTATQTALNGKLSTTGGIITGALTVGGNITSTTGGFYVGASSYFLPGAIGISTTNPAIYLDKAGSGNTATVRGRKGTVNRWFMYLGDSTGETVGTDVGSNFKLESYPESGSGATVELLIRRDNHSMTIAGDAFKPAGGSWSAVSDERVKNILGDYEHGLEQIKALHPIRYKFKGNDTAEKPESGDTVPYDKSPHRLMAETGNEYIGLSAQEVEPVMPEMVSQIAAHINGAAVNDLRQLDTNALVYALVNAVKELSARIEALEARVP